MSQQKLGQLLDIVLKKDLPYLRLWPLHKVFAYVLSSNVLMVVCAWITLLELPQTHIVQLR